MIVFDVGSISLGMTDLAKVFLGVDFLGGKSTETSLSFVDENDLVVNKGFGEVAGGVRRPLPTISVDLSVSSGTYIRSLATLLGQKLTVPAMLGDLRRTSIGQFSLDQAFTLPPYIA